MGQYDSAKMLGKEALDLEEKELGARLERMGDLNNMMASIISDVSIWNYETIQWCKNFVTVWIKTLDRS